MPAAAANHVPVTNSAKPALAFRLEKEIRDSFAAMIQSHRGR